MHSQEIRNCSNKRRRTAYLDQSAIGSFPPAPSTVLSLSAELKGANAQSTAGKTVRLESNHSGKKEHISPSQIKCTQTSNHTCYTVLKTKSFVHYFTRRYISLQNVEHLHERERNAAVGYHRNGNQLTPQALLPAHLQLHFVERLTPGTQYRFGVKHDTISLRARAGGSAYNEAHREPVLSTTAHCEEPTPCERHRRHVRHDACVKLRHAVGVYIAMNQRCHCHQEQQAQWRRPRAHCQRLHDGTAGCFFLFFF